MINNNILGLIGLAMKAGKISFGADSVEEDCKKGKIHLLIIAQDASERTQKKFKEISKVFKENYLIYANRFYKEQEQIKLPKQKLEKDYEPEKIPDIYKALVERNSVKINQNAKNIEKIALVDKYTVADKVKEMYKVLTKQKKFVFNKLFSLKKREKQEVVTAFSGLLELSRRSKVETSQKEIFGDITVEKAKRA